MVKFGKKKKNSVKYIPKNKNHFQNLMKKNFAFVLLCKPDNDSKLNSKYFSGKRYLNNKYSGIINDKKMNNNSKLRLNDWAIIQTGKNMLTVM